MDEKERLFAILENLDVEGLDPGEAIARFGGNSVLYFKILKTFVESMSAHLDKLNSFAESEDSISDYGIEVHGLKGSCYGIGANKEGDDAKTLEMAAKAGDYQAIVDGNGLFVQTMEELVVKLSGALAQANGSDSGNEKKPAPDKAVLQSMLAASQNYDAEAMQAAVKELEKYEYEKDSDLVRWLFDRVTAFAYDEIQEKLEGIL